LGQLWLTGMLLSLVSQVCAGLHAAHLQAELD
jgi:hypothetical protein